VEGSSGSGGGRLGNNISSWSRSGRGQPHQQHEQLPPSAGNPFAAASGGAPYGAGGQRLVYSSRCGRVNLQNVWVHNVGIDWLHEGNVYWRHRVARHEACRVLLHGRCALLPLACPCPCPAPAPLLLSPAATGQSLGPPVSSWHLPGLTRPLAHLAPPAGPSSRRATWSSAATMSLRCPTAGAWC
jgi:hypothetical protein